MKLRHAAALALIGWYLLQPPMRSHSGRYEYDANAPLSLWSEHAAYDSAAECEKGKAKLAEAFPDAPASSKGFLASFHCVASDDPRLKEK